MENQYFAPPNRELSQAGKAQKHEEKEEMSCSVKPCACRRKKGHQERPKPTWMLLSPDPGPKEKARKGKEEPVELHDGPEEDQAGNCSDKEGRGQGAKAVSGKAEEGDAMRTENSEGNPEGGQNLQGAKSRHAQGTGKKGQSPGGGKKQRMEKMPSLTPSQKHHKTLPIDLVKSLLSKEQQKGEQAPKKKAAFGESGDL
jgi:hypothetical protein